MSERIKALVEAVKVLASEPAQQIEHLRAIGLPEGIDELALEYDAVASAADDMLQHRELDKNQYDSVKRLDGLLSLMSGKANSRHWTIEALLSAAEWKEVRIAAKRCLRTLEMSQ